VALGVSVVSSLAGGGCITPSSVPQAGAVPTGSSSVPQAGASRSGSRVVVFMLQPEPNPLPAYANVGATVERPHGPSICPDVDSHEGCLLVACRPDLASATALDAGTIIVAANREVRVERGSDARYVTSSPRFALWDPGQLITVRVTGSNDDPPPFSTELRGPGPLVLLQPSGNDLVVERNRGLYVAWQKGIGEFVALTIASKSSDARRVTCQWPMADGQHFVSARLLAGMPAGPASFHFSARTGSRGLSNHGWTMHAWADAMVNVVGVIK
jgi:hypothetical protein